MVPVFCQLIISGADVDEIVVQNLPTFITAVGPKKYPKTGHMLMIVFIGYVL